MKRIALCLLAAGMLMLAAPSVRWQAQEKPAAQAPQKKLPAVMDLIKHQTAIRNQGARDVCPYFPPVAALEAAYRRAGVKVELSPEHLIWLRNVTCAGDNGKRDVAENLVSTLGGGNGMGVLTNYAVCREQDLPYRGEGAVAQIGNSDYYKGYELEKYDWSKPFSQFALNRWNLDPKRLPAAARANAKYAIAKYKTIPAKDLRDPRKFEEVLADHHEIIFTLLLHDDIHRLDPAQPVWRPKKGARVIGLHFMLMVGYDSNRKFFIVKNQWGPTNYTGQKDRLAENWKDIVKYDGYTLLDYDYLAAVGEAHYITEIVPADSPRFNSQRALGQWEVTFRQKDKAVMTGVLCWRRLPDTGDKKPNLRIGDLVTADGQQYRVNAKLAGNGAKPFEASLFIDFDKGTIPTTSTDGAAWKGKLTLPEKGNGSLDLLPEAGNKQTVWGVPAAEIRVTAVQVSDKNLLKGIKLAAAP
jgi:hypothetical protein